MGVGLIAAFEQCFGDRVSSAEQGRGDERFGCQKAAHEQLMLHRLHGREEAWGGSGPVQLDDAAAVAQPQAVNAADACLEELAALDARAKAALAGSVESGRHPSRGKILEHAPDDVRDFAPLGEALGDQGGGRRH